MNKKLIITALVIGVLAIIVWKLTRNPQESEGFSGAFDPSVRTTLSNIGPISVQENYCASCV